MTHASWNTSFNHTPAGLAAWLYLVNNGYLGLPSLSGFSAVAPSLSAKQNMRFAFVVQRATPVLLPQPAFAGSHSLSVTYQF